MDIENYLTAEEKKQMEGLMKRAAERRRQSTGKEEDGEVPRMYFQFQIGIGKKPEEIVQQKTDCDEELRNLLGQLYRYCKAHGYDGQQEDPPWMHEIDEELPFF